MPNKIITFQPANELANAAKLTLANMSSYYDKYLVEWDAGQIEKMTRDFINLEIVSSGEVVGILRLSFEHDECHIRDLQVNESCQSKGIGTQALDQAQKLAAQSNARLLKLKVFKISPAVNLYKRYGFKVSNDDDRFYYMEYLIPIRRSLFPLRVTQGIQFEAR